MDTNLKPVSAEELSSEYLSAKTLRDIQGIELIFATTEKGVTISVKVPWRALRLLLVAAFAIWSVIAGGGTALSRVLTKIIQ